MNLVGEINAVEAALPHLKEGASIICTGSVAGLLVGGTDGLNTGPGGLGYSFSKRQVARFVTGQQFAIDGGALLDSVKVGAPD